MLKKKHEFINIYKEIEAKSPSLIAAWPGMGLVSFGVATYLEKQLKAVEFGEIEGSSFFTQTDAVVQNGILNLPKYPKSRFYFWENPLGGDIIIFISESQPVGEKVYHLASLVLDVAERFGVKMLYTAAAMPTNIHHTDMPGIWVTVNEEHLIEFIQKYKLKIMMEGQIGGLNGFLLALAKKRKIPGICLLGEIPLYTIEMENPKASGVVLEVLAKILDIRINFEELKTWIKQSDEKIDKLLEVFSVQKKEKDEQEEEKIPDSVRVKVEKLFLEAKNNLSKAVELKKELDEWELFKEYEDRFLSLFKKKDEGGPAQQHH